jgi:hypothetical protein
MMVIDESKKISKNKDGVYVYFYNENIGEIRASIIEKIPKRNNETEIKKNKRIFPENKEYIRIKITKAENQEAVFEFQQIISKLFSIYNDLENEMIEFYSNFIPNFTKKFGQNKKFKDDTTLKELKNVKDLLQDEFSILSPRIVDNKKYSNLPDPENFFFIEVDLVKGFAMLLNLEKINFNEYSFLGEMFVYNYCVF